MLRCTNVLSLQYVGYVTNGVGDHIARMVADSEVRVGRNVVEELIYDHVSILGCIGLLQTKVSECW